MCEVDHKSMMEEAKNKFKQLLSDEKINSKSSACPPSKLKQFSSFSSSYDTTIYLAICEDNQKYIIKYGTPRISDHFIIEAKMLNFLKANNNLPSPSVHYADDKMLVMDYVEGTAPIGSHHQRQLARMLAKLHAKSKGSKAPKLFGFDFDTTIGALPQPNKKSTSWLSFFKEQRLLFMSRYAYDQGALDLNLLKRIEKLTNKLGNYLDEPAHISLIHGDIWSGNIICNNAQILSLIDPAIYYADAEIELAFMTMFGSFGHEFFDEYKNCTNFDESFFEIRRDIYNIYPLLVHVLLCGSSYIHAIEKTLKKLGQ